MSRRDWLRFVAFGGFLIVILVGMGGALSREQQGAERDAEQNKTHHTKHDERKPAPQFALFTIKREKPVEPNWGKPNCNHPRDHDEADLCQQIQMSHAAKNTVIIGYAQILLAAITFIGLVLTVIYARKAVNAAVDSATHSQTAATAATDAARAAQRQLNLAESTARNVERPYVFFRPMPARIASDTKMSLRYLVHNAGRLPAVVYEVHIEAGFPVCCSEKLMYAESESEARYEIIYQNESADLHNVLDVSCWVDQTKHTPIIFGFIRYHDPVGREYKRGFGFIYDLREGSFRPIAGKIYNYDREIEDSS